VNEAKILATLSHPNMSCFQRLERPSRLYIESNGTWEAVHSNSNSKAARRKANFSAEQAKNWLAQIAFGIAYIHDMGIVIVI